MTPEPHRCPLCGTPTRKHCPTKTCDWWVCRVDNVRGVYGRDGYIGNVGGT